MGRYKGRSSVACFNCHGLKVKCSGDTPCQRCRARGRDCSYPVRERLLSIPESYLRSLERDVGFGRNHHGGSVQENTANLGSAGVDRPSPTVSLEHDQLLEDCSAEGFVHKLKKVSLCNSNENDQRASEHALGSSPTSSRYTYSKLNFDLIFSEVSFKLPPRPYAFHLLQIFEEGFCDYHWYLRKKFHERLNLTYSNPTSQSSDRNWLCIVSVVLALAESWNHSRTCTTYSVDIESPRNPSSLYHASGGSNTPGLQETMPSIADGSSPPLPGSELFEQALLLLKMSLEEPVVEYVQALNLIAFYCYSLNRRKTAYFYAGQSVRLAKLLRLDEPLLSGSSEHPNTDAEIVEAEHRKRIWWTSYCMDRMVSTELGLATTHEDIGERLQLPQSTGLSPNDIEEFFNPHLLAAQVQLCSIKSKVVETVTHHLLIGDTTWPLDVIRPCLDMLQKWRKELPEHMSFTFEEGISPRMLELPFVRVLASLYLRYHQCFILLLRPLFLRELSSLQWTQSLEQVRPGQENTTTTAHETMLSWKLECLRAARYNAKILTDLWRIGKIAKFGYWESLHLFSALAVLSLSQVCVDNETRKQESRSPSLLDPVPRPLDTPGKSPRIDSSKIEDDRKLYIDARALLSDMVRVGNPASKDHKALLSDVEEMVDRIMTRRRNSLPMTEQLDFIGEFPNGSGAIFDGIIDEQVWYDMDWEGILKGWTEMNTIME